MGGVASRAMRGALGVLCAVAICAAAVSAGAAPKGVVVARLPSGATLRAYDGREGPCVTVRASGTTSDDCVGRVPRYAPEARLGITGGQGGTIGFGVVPADVAAVDVELPDGRRGGGRKVAREGAPRRPPRPRPLP